MSQDRFSAVVTPLEGLFVLERRPLADERGFFERMFCADTFARWGLSTPLAQINQSFTKSKAAIRGLHFQLPPHAEAKVVSCLSGEIFDVTVDIRRGSPTYLQWHGEILSAANHRSMFIPRGFAHGFQTLSDDCRLLYFHTASYVKEAESGLHALDPSLKISWPLPPGESSARDATWPHLPGTFQGVVL